MNVHSFAVTAIQLREDIERDCRKKCKKNTVNFEESVMRRMAGVEKRDRSWIGIGEIVNEVRNIMGKRDLGKAFPIHCYKYITQYGRKYNKNLMFIVPCIILIVE